MQLLAVLPNATLRDLWPLYQFFILISHVTINAACVAMVRKADKMAVIFVACIVVLQGFEMVAFTEGGRIDGLSKEIQIKKLKAVRVVLRMRLCLSRARSYRRIALEVGSLYTLSAQSGLAFQNLVLSNTVTYLLLKW